MVAKLETINFATTVPFTSTSQGVNAQSCASTMWRKSSVNVMQKYHLLLVQNNPADFECGYANGYVGVPPTHHWFGKNYMEIDDPLQENCLTYSGASVKGSKDGLWYIGFDTKHDGMNKRNWDVLRCKACLLDLHTAAYALC